MSKAPAPRRSHAALIGRITISWNEAHFWVFMCFQAIHSGFNELEMSETLYYSLKSDRTQRDATLAIAAKVIGDKELLTDIKNAFKKLQKLADRRNDITHAMWASIPLNTGEQLWWPHPRLSKKDIYKELVELEDEITTAGLRLVPLPKRILDYMPKRRIAKALIGPPRSSSP